MVAWTVLLEHVAPNAVVEKWYEMTERRRCLHEVVVPQRQTVWVSNSKRVAVVDELVVAVVVVVDIVTGVVDEEVAVSAVAERPLLDWDWTHSVHSHFDCYWESVAAAHSFAAVAVVVDDDAFADGMDGRNREVVAYSPCVSAVECHTPTHHPLMRRPFVQH